MTAPPRTRRPFDWEAAGEELGDTLSSYHMIIVAGADSVTTGETAVGIARMQSMHRRVAVGDLFAESPPIRDLIRTDDPHGIVDSFLYGVSLSRIAYPVQGPVEVVGDTPVAVLDADLRAACLKALAIAQGDQNGQVNLSARGFALEHSWRACTRPATSSLMP